MYGIKMLKIQDGNIYADTPLLSAIITDGKIMSLTNKKTGTQLVNAELNKAPAMELVYANNQTEPIADSKNGSITAYQVNAKIIELRISGWYADSVMVIKEDPATGELLLTPSAYSARKGVRSIRFNISGINRDLNIIAPIFQGINLKLNDPLISNMRSPWPREWEAGFAILQGNNEGFMVWTQDTQYRYKSIQFGHAEDIQTVGFEAESYGPLHANYSAGGLTWRIGIYEGDWHVPALKYRNWLWNAYDLNNRSRPHWVHEISFCACWLPVENAILDALAKRVKPSKTLLHIPNWRVDRYDQNYPDYIASPEAEAFMKKALSMGFHIAPHANIFEIDPSNPAYELLGQFEYRDLETDQRLGWSVTVSEDGKRSVVRVPMANRRLLNNRECNTMVKIHPAQPMWHSILRENLQNAKRAYGLDCIFTDVSHNTFNLSNCLVDNTTSTEGAKILQDYLSQIDDGLMLGGEGLNEITMQSQAFAQVHLFKSSGTSIAGLERTGGIDLGDFLWGKLCRSVGYNKIAGKDEDETLRMRIHEEHGTIPTISARSADEILDPNPAVIHAFDMANQN